MSIWMATIVCPYLIEKMFSHSCNLLLWTNVVIHTQVNTSNACDSHEFQYNQWTSYSQWLAGPSPLIEWIHRSLQSILSISCLSTIVAEQPLSDPTSMFTDERSRPEDSRLHRRWFNEQCGPPDGNTIQRRSITVDETCLCARRRHGTATSKHSLSHCTDQTATDDSEWDSSRMAFSSLPLFRQPSVTIDVFVLRWSSQWSPCSHCPTLQPALQRYRRCSSSPLIDDPLPYFPQSSESMGQQCGWPPIRSLRPSIVAIAGWTAQSIGHPRSRKRKPSSRRSRRRYVALASLNVASSFSLLAFTNSNYAIQSAVFTAWSSFIAHLHRLDDLDQPAIQTRLLKLFLTPFLSDSTSKSKSASISKCHAWTSLISFYPKNVSEVILPFLSFAFGNELTSKVTSTTTAWWPECRQIGGQYLHDLLADPVQSEHAIRTAGDQILNYAFDFIVDQFLETSVQSNTSKEKPLSLLIWNAFLKHLMTLFQSNNAIQEKQRVAINTCLLKRIEQCWIDSRIETRLLLKLFETFEQIAFPLAIETVLRDTGVRTKTLLATQNYSLSGNNKTRKFSLVTSSLLNLDKTFLEDKATHCRTTLSDQYLHMMIEHGIRFNDDDQSSEDAYLHVISYLIETLSKISDENFCLQTTSLLVKCSAELPIQPMAIPSLFWHIWFRCSTHLIQVLNRSRTFELNNALDNQKQDTSIELLLRPFAFNDIPRLDFSHTALWIQLFKALCRLAMLNHDQSKSMLIHLLAELLRNKPAFEQAIHDEHNQRLFGLMLIIIKTLIKTMAEFDLFSIHDRSTTQALNLFSMTQKRSLPSSMLFCLTQLSTIVNDILQRSLSNSENNTQYLLVCSCLLKSNKLTSSEQSKSTVFTFLRDILVDLFNLCKIYAHLEILLTNLTELLPFLVNYESSTSTATTGTSSPISVQKQTTDLVLLTKILAVISSVSDQAHSSSLLQLGSPLLILAFQHTKTVMRNKARKCWNETFGRLTFLIYPNELR